MNTSSGTSAAVMLQQSPNIQTALNPQQHANAHSRDSLLSLVTKRSATWRYLQRTYQGGTVLYNTAILSETELRRTYGPMDEKIQRRQIPVAADCLRAVYNLVQEFDALTMSESKAKMGVVCWMASLLKRRENTHYSKSETW
ncbi:hypothetical protein BGZ94_002008 [Podila epigama]|nr:hypothetical protein BGZ94_002008 [Podila epigama]